MTHIILPFIVYIQYVLSQRQVAPRKWDSNSIIYSLGDSLGQPEKAQRLVFIALLLMNVLIKAMVLFSNDKTLGRQIRSAVFAPEVDIF